MPFITPQHISNKAARLYPKFLKAWVRGEEAEFFPYRLRVKLAPDPNDVASTIADNERLTKSSKSARGWGYTLHLKEVRSRSMGKNFFPARITIDTRDDLLQLAKKQHHFRATEAVVSHVRSELPKLEGWLASNVGSLAAFEESYRRLVDVTRYFVQNPWPDCYARQIPVGVDTKFIERHKKVLRQWFDTVLSGAGIDPNERNFYRRFGLRDQQPHRAIRFLDDSLRKEIGIPFRELSLPLSAIGELPITDANVFIVENNLNLLTLPPHRRGLAIRGEGNAVNRLRQIDWLGTNRVYYWGDIDVDGFLILSRLRAEFPQLQSILMDQATVDAHRQFVVAGNGKSTVPPANLTASEAATFTFCHQSNARLEQEKLLQPFVDRAIRSLPSTEKPNSSERAAPSTLPLIG